MTASAGWLRWVLPSGSGMIALEAARGIGSVAVAMVVVLSTATAARVLLDVDSAARVSGTIFTVGHQIPTGDAWTERLSDPSAWRGGRDIGGRRGQRSTRIDDELPKEPAFDEDRPPERTGFNSGTYRTVCVRLCDGYFFPISFATTPEHFAEDAATCSSRCNSSARLYVYPNPGGEPEQMTALDGKPYTALPSAFLFRTKYDAACTCKPQPWSQEALARHRAYADAEKKSRTRTVARTIRPEQRQADATDSSSGVRAPERPQGAMLLGSEQPRPRVSRKPDGRPKARSRSSRLINGGRNDWRHRAFTGN
jgi:hypothetical protein